MDGVGADEFGRCFRVLVFEYERNDFDQVVVKLVESIGGGMGSPGRSGTWPTYCRVAGQRLMMAVKVRMAGAPLVVGVEAGQVIEAGECDSTMR